MQDPDEDELFKLTTKGGKLEIERQKARAPRCPAAVANPTSSRDAALQLSGSVGSSGLQATSAKDDVLQRVASARAPEGALTGAMPRFQSPQFGHLAPTADCWRRALC